ncbi:MT-A70 family methyltransferase [Beijerinckia sp. L45]|uniref:MT-A70 family methyltransferase n=1 Tax=Beijerinckia sp. L45 TaxID=1641855 RepID=UPI001FEDEF2D|nr:MT-A70 family methyltransferase [Beijerinckia sp. L45]
MNAPLVSFQPSLFRYDEACRAIAAAKAVDEVKDVRNRVDALRHYARQSKNKQLEVDASEIRFRAERRIGALMADQRGTVGLSRGAAERAAGSDETRAKPTLAEAGIDKNLADRARRYAAVPEEKFEELLADRRKRIEHDNARVTVNLLQEAEKAERRAAREAELGARQYDLPQKRYGVILADHEWKHETWSEAGLDRAAANHYPTSSLTALCARDIASIAAPDCLYAMWALVPMLAEAFVVLDAHGFARFERDPETGFLTIDKRAGRYVSSGSWTKYKPGAGIGMGYWFRVDHEILLIATRGNMPAPTPGTQARSVFDVPASQVHSQKPELVCEILESYFPTLPKIELNRRGAARPGWDAWGNEAEDLASEDSEAEAT